MGGNEMITGANIAVGGVVLEGATLGLSTAAVVGVGALGVEGLSTASNGLNNLLNPTKVEANPGSRSGKSFTPAKKRKVIESGTQADGSIPSNTCGVNTTKPSKSQKGVTPPKTDRQVDHIRAKSKGGSGTAENGQVLCRDCNTKNGNKKIDG